MKITKLQLLTVMPNAERNIKANTNFKGYNFDAILRYLNETLEEFKINTPLRVQHFLAQIAHESMEFRYTEEIASGAAYDTGALAIKLGNTPQKDGDGQKYKGRGVIQITGLANYKAYAQFCGFDVVSQPTLLAKPKGAFRSAGWFFATHGCLPLADRDDVIALTKKINGGLNGITERKKYLTRSKLVIK